jgi:hypothetical protein
MHVRRSSLAAIAVAFAALVGTLFAVVGPPGAAGAAAPGCHPSRHVVCLGRGDGGHSVRVEVGQTVTVGLGGSDLRWEGLREIGPHLLRQHGVTAVRHGVLTASYVATKAGRTGLQASGAPKCAPGEACPQFILLWQVRIVVARSP